MAVNYLVCNPTTDVISWSTSPIGGSDYVLCIDKPTKVIGWSRAGFGDFGTDLWQLTCESTTGVISWTDDPFH